jgi:hypothetical protein
MLHSSVGCNVSNDCGAFETSITVDASQRDDRRGCEAACVARCGRVFTMGGGQEDSYW